MEDSIGIDIVIPCYNAEKYVEQSIMSALKQTYANKKVIFVDNESTDNSLKIAKNLQKENPSLVVLEAPNLYEYSWQEPVEVAMQNCSNKYFTILAADDYIEEQYIEKIMNIMKRANFKIKVLQSPLLGFTSKSGTHLDKLIQHSYKNLQEFKELLFKRCPVNTPTVFYSRELYDAGLIQWKSEIYKGSGDYNCYFNLADKNIFIYPVPIWLGYKYRWHEDQSTWGMQKNFNEIDFKIKEYWRKQWMSND